MGQDAEEVTTFVRKAGSKCMSGYNEGGFLKEFKSALAGKGTRRPGKMRSPMNEGIYCQYRKLPLSQLLLQKHHRDQHGPQSNTRNNTGPKADPRCI